jgi:small subunit ribosomal protein S6
MRIYETTFVVNPQTDDASIDREVQSVSDLITSNGGRILVDDRIGTRRLAYELRGLTQGFYTTFIYEAPKQVLPRLDRHFKLGEAYLRNLTVICE